MLVGMTKLTSIKWYSSHAFSVATYDTCGTLQLQDTAKLIVEIRKHLDIIEGDKYN